MKIDIYRSAKNTSKYLSVRAGTDVTKIVIPEDFDPDLRQLCPFTSTDVSPDDERIALKADEVIAQIEKQGYATHGAKVKVSISKEPARTLSGDVLTYPRATMRRPRAVW